MAAIVEITQLSPTMSEGLLVEWQKKEGDVINPGDIIASVETDKAVMDLEAFDEGVLLKQIAETGSKLPVGSPIAIIGENGEDITSVEDEARKKLQEIIEKGPQKQQEEPEEDPAPAEPATTSAADSSETPVKETEEAGAAKTTGATSPGSADEHIKASPLARNLASHYKVDLSQVKGTGPGGRIVKKDIEEARHKAGPRGGSITRSKDQKQPVSMIRQVIAKRLTDSKSHVPHFYLRRIIATDRLAELRRQVNSDLQTMADDTQEGQGMPAGYPEKVSVNDFIIRANALALAKHPEVNAQWGEDHLLFKANVDIGIAVAIDDGLITPIIRNADQKSLYQVALEARSLAARARARKLQQEDYTGGTFTISNLGMFGIDSFEAIINAPEAALMAVGSSKIQPVFNKETGEFSPSEQLTVTLSCDHRVIDGALGAVYLQSFAHFLEHPTLLL